MWLIGGTLPLAIAASPSACTTPAASFAPDGTLAARYDKMHLFRYDNGRERYDEVARAARRRASRWRSSAGGACASA